MSLDRVASLLAGALWLLAPTRAHAQCAMDTDCKGDRVCEKGKCVASPPVRAASPPAAAPASNAVGPQPAVAVALAPAAPPEPPKMVRHSTGMMVGGIVAVSLAPVALLTAGVAGIGKGICRIDNRENTCDDVYDTTIYGGLLSAVVLVGVGVPLIVIGAKREPANQITATITVRPWVLPQSAGMSLRVDL